MTAEQAELWQRIQALALDEPGVAFPFSARLARDEGWTVRFTRQAIEEYKRFVLLAMTAGHPVTPSEAVDQVWHEHLTYTRSYWQKLCGEVLGRPLHHEPTRGGPAEGAKFREWYARTLASYRAAFGEEPPADIWPPVEERFAQAERGPRLVRVDATRHWILPKLRAGVWRWAPVAAAALAVAGCGTAAVGAVWPFSLSGREFLVFFPVAWAVAFFAAVIWRSRLRAPHDLAAEAGVRADPYVHAMVAGGVPRVMLAALARLGAVHVAEVERSGAISYVKTCGPAPAGLHPVERAVHALVEEGEGRRAYHDLPGRLEGVLSPLREEAEERGWVLSARAARRARVTPLLLALVPIVIGGVRLVQGITRDRPVGFLALMTIVGTVAVLMAVGRRVWRTGRGDAVLRRLEREHSRLKAGTGIDFADANAVPLAVGLFGVGVLADTQLHAIHTQLKSIQRGGAGDGGGSTGCSASGCGSADGGSGCGSGCGGCGGGD